MDINDIKKSLTGLEKYFVSDVQVRTSDGSIVLYVPKDKVSNTSKSGYVSHRQLQRLVGHLKRRYQSQVHIVYLKSRKVENLERGVFELLNSRFDNVVEQLFLKCDSAFEITAWIFANNLTHASRSDVEKVFKKLISESSFTLGSIQWLDAQTSLPTIFNILVATKSLQPVSLEMAQKYFEEEFPEISDRWLNRQYDKLLKKGLVLREHDFKSYSLTAKGLEVVPNPKNRYSSDISRALALGVRKW
ncbi:hypothetical protein GNT65_16755 [Shewanella sp. JBTF-M18]|uniref:Uncharacterized protein n=1 Tax=Shewanella insulae TaxID=2681496 RepID=A0A6L7I221_9GAMM|nr:hypothetical protein [Shewanella insulae]MXR70310.1 hypothetical protein [Shewanella insulae]